MNPLLAEDSLETSSLIFSENSEKIFMHVVCCSRDWRFMVKYWVTHCFCRSTSEKAKFCLRKPRCFLRELRFPPTFVHKRNIPEKALPPSKKIIEHLIYTAARLTRSSQYINEKNNESNRLILCLQKSMFLKIK